MLAFFGRDERDLSVTGLESAIFGIEMRHLMGYAARGILRRLPILRTGTLQASIGLLKE